MFLHIPTFFLYYKIFPYSFRVFLMWKIILFVLIIYRKCYSESLFCHYIDTNSRNYGVVQSVDHKGRTAVVQWMRTYVTGVSTEPEKLGDATVSVYDLKDHPDFRFRPGSFVIRIANIPVSSSNIYKNIL